MPFLKKNFPVIMNPPNPTSFCIVLRHSLVDAFSSDLKTYPRFAKARAISFEQKPGELLIIPPGWFHQVRPVFVS